jgi:uncharacterized repeat protein (TIGR03803 family)
MSYKKFLGAASAALMIVIVLTLALAPAAGATSKVLHEFHNTDGADPSADLIFDAAGNLYSTTFGGGAHGKGTVFELTPNADGSWTESVLYTFCSLTNCSDGAFPIAGLIFDTAGNLYGTTGGGGVDHADVVFKLTPNADGGWTESVLHTFNGSDGHAPDSGLIFDAAGNLYGTTLDGGAHRSDGVAFKLTPNADRSWTESVLHSFNGSDGEGPTGLIFDAAGNLYGTTYYGGAHGRGTAFKLTPKADGSWTESVLHSFNTSDGAFPDAGLIFDAAGNLYGTTEGGGNSSVCDGGCGTVFELIPQKDGSWAESVLHPFNDSGGAFPDAGLIFDAAGNLYGTASFGGSANDGTAFKLSPNEDGSWAYSLLHAFQGKPALEPADGLVLGSAGTLYGTTVRCSSGCKGVVYQITP